MSLRSMMFGFIPASRRRRNGKKNNTQRNAIMSINDMFLAARKVPIPDFAVLYGAVLSSTHPQMPVNKGIWTRGL